MDEEDFYSSPEYDQLMVDNPIEEMTDEGPTELDLLPYIDAATSTGVDSPWLQGLKGAWTTGGKALDSVSSWAKANPGLLSIITSGVSGAMKNKAAGEQSEQARRWTLEDRAQRKADEAELWERKNQSVINTKPAKLGILGAGMYDKHIDYLKTGK
jgi:hypothetical protein